MRPKAAVKIWVLFLLAALSYQGFSQQFIETNASGGIFKKDQNLSFVLLNPGWMRLLLDGREIYRGSDPAYPELGVPQGDERGFTLTAECYSPQGELRESFSWYIYIDKKAPPLPDMEFRNSAGGLRLFKAGGEPSAVIRAFADIDGNLVFFPNMEDAASLPVDFFPSDSFQALVWAEDLAGNCSEFRGENLGISFVRIENPVPGVWLNQQTLIIAGAEGRDIYWTADGSHPLEPGGSGRLYREPLRITREGRITVRIAWREDDGKIREDRVVYTVSEGGGVEAKLDSLFKSEERVISTPITIQLPHEWLWSMGEAPREQPEESVTLRPEPLITRAAALHLSPSPVSGIYRFVYLLDGGGKNIGKQGAGRMELSPDMTIKKEFLYNSGEREAFPPLTLVSAGRCRVIAWPENQRDIYYSWGGSWQEAKGPLTVPIQGGTLKWFTLENADSDFEGIYSTAILSVMSASGKRGISGGRIAFRNYRGSSSWEYVSPLLDYSPGIIRNPGRDVCDGEDLEWAFVSTGGKILEQQRRNRLSPPVPVIDGLPESGWTRGPLKLSINQDEEGIKGIIEARLRYASGAFEELRGTGSLEIASSSGELAELTLEAYLIDSFGNRGPVLLRKLVIDPKTIYVSSEPSMGRSAGGAEGDMDKPFTSLEEALAYANRQGIGNIRIAGNLELAKPITVSGKLHIDGAWKNGAVVNLKDAFCWNLNNNADFTLSALRLERQKGGSQLINAGKTARLLLTDVDIVNEGPLLTMEGGVCAIADSRIELRVPGEKRSAAVSAADTVFVLKNSSVQLNGNYGLIFDLRGGSFSSEESELIAQGIRTSTLVALNRTRGNLKNTDLKTSALDYSSALEASGAELVISGGKLEVSARNTSALMLENCSAVVLETRIQVEGIFSTRAFEIRGQFPLVDSCRFYSTGSAASSEVFSGNEIPKAGNIAGNLFSGFTHIWGPGWPIERLKVFNQDYALPEKPNTASGRP